MENYTCTKLPSTRKKRTAIVYFGEKSEYIEIISDKVKYIKIVTSAMTMSTAEHKENCKCKSRYTRHRSRGRAPKNYHGEKYELPISQVRCLECQAVFTILPSFLARYQRWDVDGLSKMLEINLIMTSSYRHTQYILGYSQKLAWNPKGIMSKVHWLGNLLPLPQILLNMDLTARSVSRFKSIQQASTYDIEWNGQSL